MTAQPKPRSVEIIGDETLAIIWEDGHETFLPGADLRANCPCAQCRTRRLEPKAPSATGLTLMMAPPRLLAAEVVGRYAVRLQWTDGHASGIFEHRLLRDLCGCPSCLARGSGA